MNRNHLHYRRKTEESQNEKNEIVKKLEHINRILHAESREELEELCPYAKKSLKNKEISICAVITGCASLEMDGLLNDIKENGF